MKPVDEIMGFVDQRTGAADDVVLKVRQVLETHLRRSHTAYFPDGRNFGQIVRDITEAGPSHPCHGDVGRLDACNAATCDKHHGGDAIMVAKRGVDLDKLWVIASDALEAIGARRPAAGLRRP